MSGIPPHTPEDRYGRWLLTIVGVLVIAAGVALIWKDTGTGSVTAAIAVITAGTAMTFAAAFYDTAVGIVRLRGGSEVRFGGRELEQSGAGATPPAPDRGQTRRLWRRRDP